MTRYLMYKNTLNNMEDKRLPKIALNSIHNHLQLKRDGIKMPFYRVRIPLKILLNKILRRKCGVINN
jgi:hypothetical protein